MKRPVSQRIWIPRSPRSPRSKSASGYGTPGPNPLADIILNVLVKIDDTLRSSAYESMFLIQNMRIVNAYELASRRMFLLTKGKWARIKFNVWSEVVF